MAVLFHELIHVAGGEELDAETFENLLFTPSEGAVQPTRDDWSAFVAERRTGQWVRLNARTGAIIDCSTSNPILRFTPVRPRRRK